MTVALLRYCEKVKTGIAAAIASGSLSQLEYLGPIKDQRNDSPDVEARIKAQRRCFKNWIDILFPIREVDSYIGERVAAGDIACIEPSNMSSKFSVPLRKLILNNRPTSHEPFNLKQDRSSSKLRSGLFHKKEVHWAVMSMKTNDEVILATLSVRRMLVELGKQIASTFVESVPEDIRPSLRMVCNSWNQNTFVHTLYPALVLHMASPENDRDYPAVTQNRLELDACVRAVQWLIRNQAFRGKANYVQHGHNTEMTCAATRFLAEGFGQLGWVARVADSIGNHGGSEINFANKKLLNESLSGLIPQLPKSAREILDQHDACKGP